MNKRDKKLALPSWGLRIALLCCVACPALAFAADKEYPIAGNVVALGTYQEAAGSGSIPPVHRTYTVKTPTRVFVLACPFWMNGFHIHSPSECGGSKNIAIGDVMHFRIEKNLAIIPTDKGKEQKLRIMSEGINEDAAKQSANP